MRLVWSDYGSHVGHEISSGARPSKQDITATGTLRNRTSLQAINASVSPFLHQLVPHETIHADGT